MRVATWNVNSIRPRIDQVTRWLDRASPDVLCMQETKVDEERFPALALQEAGYRSAHFGERGYNGVCISARFGLSIDDVVHNLAGDDDRAPRRAIAATVEGVRILCIYAPNGQSVGTQAWAYKLAWLDRLRAELTARYSPDDELLVCGDFNVAPETIDVDSPRRWEQTVLFHPEAREKLRALFAWGLVDTLRDHHAEAGLYTWWDYRAGMFKNNRGLRIDLALATKRLAARVKDVIIDREPREEPRPSDHVPVLVEIE